MTDPFSQQNDERFYCGRGQYDSSTHSRPTGERRGENMNGLQEEAQNLEQCPRTFRDWP